MNGFPWRIALFIVRVLVGGIFAYAGWAKMFNGVDFADSISTFKILPVELLNIAALTLPPLEIFLGVLLICGIWVRQATFGIIILCVIFGGAIIQAMVRGLEIDCGCFGSGSSASGWKTFVVLVRDSIIFGAALLIYIYTLKREGLKIS